ncbi:hypothetical protein MMC24_002645 [Lignoscripta atroalba]|nr:hypothetical protein [Lignoscripta atroalba]
MVFRKWTGGTANIARCWRPLQLSKSGIDRRKIAYIYTPLPDTRSIRLVELYPLHARVSLDGEMHCRIRTVNLDDAPPFMALSYAWGSSILAKSVQCNGYTLPVTQNLHAALVWLRQYPIQYYWIDAISINQQDNAERSQQVKIMKSIYQEAKGVPVWLGEEDEDTGPAIDLIDKLAKLLSEKDLKSKPNAIEAAIMRRTFEDGKAMTKLGLPLYTSTAWISLAKLFERPYFQRTWIIQELSVNTHIFACCGRHVTTWINIQAALSFLRVNGWFQTFDIKAARDQPTIGRNTREFIFNSFRVRDALHFPEKKEWLFFETLLDFFRQTHATDPRDKIIALLGLASDVGDGKRFDIAPDYNKSVVDFYRDVTGLLLKNGHSLGALSFVEDHSFRRIHELPSWVPDYSTTTQRAIGSFNQSPVVVYGASGDTPVWVKWSSGSSLLYVKAIITDEVQKISRSSFEDPRSCIFETLLEWYFVATAPHNFDDPSDMKQRMMEILLLQEPFSESLETFWRTAIGDLGGGTHPSSPESRKDFVLCLLLAIRNCLTNNPQSSLGSGIDSAKAIEVVWAITQAFIDQHGHANAYNYLNYFHQNSREKRFFVTEKGRMGTGMKSMEYGDLVCILSGGRVPYLVRKSGQHYRFVGEAYVHGLMHGEGLSVGDAEFEEICIK